MEQYTKKSSLIYYQIQYRAQFDDAPPQRGLVHTIHTRYAECMDTIPPDKEML
jgi:hypothetical protein